jgi:hypothetical protein
MKNIYNSILVIILLSCGEPTVDLNSNLYKPLIVVDSYLIVGQKVENIFIKRNFNIASVNADNRYIDNATVSITDLSNNQKSTLIYQTAQKSYSDQTNTLGLVKEKTAYRIDVEATIDGKTLSTSSTTNTPSNGFCIINKSDQMKKYPVSNDDRYSNRFAIDFTLSNDATSYIFIFKALDTKPSSYIRFPRNVYLAAEVSDADFIYEVGEISHLAIQNLNSDISSYNKKIEWSNFNFVSRYRVMVLAVDKNYKDYFYTVNDIQDIDGSFVHPQFHFEGDGIGIFGSAVADTIFFEVSL